MSNFEKALDKKGINGHWKRGQYYVKLRNFKGTLKIKKIDPTSFVRAEETDKFSVTLETTSGNTWTEYFGTTTELANFVESKLEESKEN